MVDRLTPEELIKCVTQITNDSLEEVAARVEVRLGHPEIRQHISQCYTNLLHAAEIHDPLRIYKASVDLCSVNAFGKNYQEVNLRVPPIVEERERDLLNKLHSTHSSLTQADLVATRQNLEEIPALRGSECDKGKFNGCHHEVLVVAATTAEALRNLLPASKADLRAKRRIKRCIDLAPEIADVIYGLEQNNRETVFWAWSKISETSQKLLKPETFFEKTFRQLKTLLAKTPTAT